MATGILHAFPSLAADAPHYRRYADQTFNRNEVAKLFGVHTSRVVRLARLRLGCTPPGLGSPLNEEYPSALMLQLDDRLKAEASFEPEPDDWLPFSCLLEPLRESLGTMDVIGDPPLEHRHPSSLPIWQAIETTRLVSDLCRSLGIRITGPKGRYRAASRIGQTGDPGAIPYGDRDGWYACGFDCYRLAAVLGEPESEQGYLIRMADAFRHATGSEPDPESLPLRPVFVVVPPVPAES